MAAYAAVARYKFDGADSGTAVTTVPDDTGNLNPLTIAFNAMGSWGSTAAGRGVIQTQTQGGAGGTLMRVQATAGNIAAQFSGKREASARIVFSYDGPGSGDGNLIVLGHTAGGDGVIRVTTNGYDVIGVAFASEDADGATQYYRQEFYTGVYGAGIQVLDVVFDSTQAVQADRAKLWRNGTQVTTINSALIPLNAEIPTLGASHYLAIGNRVTGANQVLQGKIWYAEIGTGQLTTQQITDGATALAADNDADWNAPPVLALTAPLTLDQVVATSLRANVTTSVNATVDYVVGAAASAQPSEPTFDASTIGGSSTAFSPFQTTIPALTPGASIRVHVRVSDGTTTLYDYEDVTLPAVSNVILSVNGGTPIRYDQTSFDITWDTAPGVLSAVTLNGVAQGAHTAINSTTTRVARTSANWPATRYNTTISLVTGAASAPTSMGPATGYGVQRLAVGYVENPPQTIDSNSDAVAGDEIIIHLQGGALSIDSLGRLTFNAGFNGLVEWAIVDQADGAHSAFAFYPYSAGADILPTVPTLIANVTGANPGQPIRGSFVLAGVTAATDIPVVAAGFMQVSATDGSGYGPSITRQLGQTVYYEIIAGAFGEVRTGNVSMNGVTAASPLSVAARAANAPSITTQPSNQSVTSGAVATFSVAATNAATYQWQKDTAGNGTYANISGATSATYARTTSDADLGTSNVRCVVTSSEGASTTSASATLTVIAAATRLVIPAGVVTGRGASMAGATAVPINIRNVNGALIHSTTVTIAASGVTNIDSNQNGAVGTDRFVGFPSSVDGSEALIRLTVQAAS